MTKEKRQLMSELGNLLGVAGVEMTWEELERELDRLPLRVLRALLYRVGRAQVQAFDEGLQYGAEAPIS